jgi:UDP-glucose 4-epimerase
MKSILLTGAAGFIGSHICVKLISCGYDVVALDNLSNTTIETVENIEKITKQKLTFYKADILDGEKLNEIFRTHGISVVIHLAGLKSVAESMQNPLKYYHSNVAGSISLFKVMAEYGCRKIVFSSSAAVYGTTGTPPFLEDMPLSAVNPYGRCKIQTEQILRDIADNTWSVVALRYFNPVGAHESGFLGELLSADNLVPKIAGVALGKAEKITVFGNDYPTPDGTGIRDYIHISDLADGHICALEHIRVIKGFLPVNLGTGRGYSVFEVIRAYEKVCGKEIPVEVCPRRDGDVAVCFADVSKAKTFLDWTAKLGLDDMCESNWKFMVNNQRLNDAAAVLAARNN